MSNLRWPTLFLTVLKVLGQLHEVTSDERRIMVSKQYDANENNRYSVQQSDPSANIHNFTLLESSHVGEYQEETPVTPSSPDYAMLNSDEIVNISTFLEPSNNGNQYPGANAEVSKPSSENNRRKISSFIEPNTSSPDISSKVNDELHPSPLSNSSYIPIVNLPDQETGEPFITVSHLEDEKVATISEEQNTFPSTKPPEIDSDSFISTTVMARNVRHQKEDAFIQHIPVSARSKTLTVPEHRNPHGVYSIDNEKAFTTWEALPEVTETTFYTEISVQRQTTEGYHQAVVSSDSSRKNSDSSKEVDTFKEDQAKDINQVSFSESIIRGHNIDQEVQKPKTQKSTSNDGMMVTSIPSYHPNDVMHLSSSQVYPSDMMLNTTRKGTHPCARMCKDGEPPMTCRYNFSLEWYYTMSKACFNCPLNLEDCDRQDCVPADGVRRPIVVVNRELPGPSVEVCKGDRIIVDMENRMMEESTTIHWHGHHQRGTQYMDGVPYITQCPIPPKSTFRYHYMSDTPGTHFWHSHSGCQRADGAFGALIIRVPPSKDPHRELYDQDLSEHIIQILDWDHTLGVDKFLAHHHANGNNKPETLLVNGRGRFHQFIDADLQPRNATFSPTAEFTVQKGIRYRFRLINAGFLNCPIELSVDNHTILVISSDGSDIKAVEADSLVSYAGERFDFVLNANNKVGNYWMRFRGLMDCDERFTKAHQVAVLHYDGAPELEEPSGEVSYEAARRKGLQVNSLNVGRGIEGSLVIPELNATADDDISLKEKPDMTFYLSYDFYKIDNPHYHRAPYYGFNEVVSTKEQLQTPQLNHISLKLPPFPLLSQHNDLGTKYHFCNESTVHNCSSTYCECTHVIQVPLGAVLELILVDKGKAFDANHPFHLHGHAFRVVAMERLGSTTSVEEVQALDKAGLIYRKLQGAPMKDTVTVPDGGFTIVRVHANNPGYWLFHCHIEFHVELGMAVVFKVGEHSDFPPPPKGFPQCNSYMPTDEELDHTHEEDNEIGAPVISITQWWPLRSSGTSKLIAIPLIPLLIMSAAVR